MSGWLERRRWRKAVAEGKSFHEEWRGHTVRVIRGPWADAQGTVQITDIRSQSVEMACRGKPEHGKEGVVRLWFRVADLEKVPS